MNFEKNKKKQNFLFVSILFLTFATLLSGCTRDPTDLNIYVGTQGVTAEFSQNNPPREVYEGSQVILMAEVWNRGAYTPGTAREPQVYVSVNVDDVYFKLNDGKYQDNIMTYYLQGKSPVWPIGEKTISIVGTLNVNEIPGTWESPTTKLEISACYPYKTYFSESVCIDTDIYSLETKPICRNKKNYRYSSGQGAPLIVSGLDVDMVPVGVETSSTTVSQPVLNREGQLVDIGHGTVQGKNIIIEPNFRIYFRVADKGVILAHMENENPCIEGPSQDGIILKLNASLGTTKLVCEDAEIQMYASEGSVRCTLPAESVNSQFELNRNYELPLRVEAEYFYKITSTKDVRIVRVS